MARSVISVSASDPRPASASTSLRWASPWSAQSGLAGAGTEPITAFIEPPRAGKFVPEPAAEFVTTT